jgi:hypothetical protein
VLNAGPGQVLSVTFTPEDTTNYAPATASVALDVAKAAPLVTWVNPAPTTDRNPLSSDQLNATANIPGTFVYTPPAGTTLNVGKGQLLAVAFTPADAANYAAAARTVRIDVCMGQTVEAKPPARAGYNGVEAMWQDMGLTVQAGDVLTITASGTWQHAGQTLTAAGDAAQVVTGPNTPLPGGPLLALVGRIGAAGPPFRVQSGQPIPVTTSGALYLTANDNWYATWDNAGSLTVSLCVGAPMPVACTGVRAAVPESAVVGAPVTLAAQMTPAGCVGAVTYAWEFGDGGAAAVATATHAYAGAGAFTWQVSATVDGVPVPPATGTVRVTTDVCTGQTVEAKPPARAGYGGVEAMWQDMGSVVKAGDVLTITASGTWQQGGQSLTAAGDAAQVVTGPNTPLPGGPLLALVGRIGPAGTPFRVQSGQPITVTAGGTLYLTANDNWYATWDNTGRLAVSLCVGR